jgi:hypothetical protein
VLKKELCFLLIAEFVTMPVAVLSGGSAAAERVLVQGCFVRPLLLGFLRRRICHPLFYLWRDVGAGSTTLCSDFVVRDDGGKVSVVGSVGSKNSGGFCRESKRWR